MNQHKLVIDKNLILWDYNLSTKNSPLRRPSSTSSCTR